MRYLDPKNDLVFKKIFAEHPHLLISFLNSVLPLEENQKILSIEYLPAELTPVVPLFKYTIVDVRCKDILGRQFIVEMQMLWTKSFQNRVLFNASKAFVKQLEKGEQFELLQPVYALSLVNQNFVEDEDAYFHHYKIVTVGQPQLQMKGLEFIFVELPKIKATNLHERALGILWLRFLSDIEAFMKTNLVENLESSEIRKAIELSEESAYSKEELESYERYWDQVRVEKAFISDALEKGYGIGKEEGKIEGMIQGKIEAQELLILNSFRKGLSVDLISAIVQMPLEEVNRVLKKEGLV
jgi:predicted transposase/invertase (TIGR01784 family)